MADLMRVMGLHTADCWAVEDMHGGEITSPWDWQKACENDAAGRVMVPCACELCGAYIVIETSEAPRGGSYG